MYQAWHHDSFSQSRQVPCRLDDLQSLTYQTAYMEYLMLPLPALQGMSFQHPEDRQKRKQLVDVSASHHLRQGLLLRTFPLQKHEQHDPVRRH